MATGWVEKVGEQVVLTVRCSDIQDGALPSCLRLLAANQVDEVHITWHGEPRLKLTALSQGPRRGEVLVPGEYRL